MGFKNAQCSRSVCFQGVWHPLHRVSIPMGSHHIAMKGWAGGKKQLGNHLFLFCSPSAWETDWQLEGEGPESALIVSDPYSNRAAERAGPHSQGKNGNFCVAWHSKCHLCEDLDLLRSVFNNLGCSRNSIFLFPLSPVASLPSLFLLHQQALFQSGLNPLSIGPSLKKKTNPTLLNKILFWDCWGLFYPFFLSSCFICYKECSLVFSKGPGHLHMNLIVCVHAKLFNSQQTSHSY